MSDGLVCDACGATLLLDSDVRYVVDVRGYAAYDVLEITSASLERDLEGEMERLLEGMDSASAEELENQVAKSWRLDLCPDCWRRYLRDPLAGLRPSPGGEAEERKKSQGN